MVQLDEGLQTTVENKLPITAETKKHKSLIKHCKADRQTLKKATKAQGVSVDYMGDECMFQCLGRTVLIFPSSRTTKPCSAALQGLHTACHYLGNYNELFAAEG